VLKGGLKGTVKAVKGAVKNTVKTTVKSVKELGQIGLKGAKTALKNGKIMLQGVKGGFAKGAKSLDDLARQLVGKLRFNKFKIRLQGRRIKLLGHINPWIVIADGHIDVVAPGTSGAIHMPDAAMRHLPGIENFFATNPLSKDALESFIKIAREADSNDIARSLAQKVMQHGDIPGMERWIKATARQINNPNQLLDMQASLDDAIGLKAAGHSGLQIEVYYHKGRELTDPTEIRSIKDKPNVDVVTDTMRREWKRVNTPIKDRKTLLGQIQDARLKFRDAGLPRGTSSKENIGLVDFGDHLTKGGMREPDAIAEIRRFLNRDQIAKGFLDKLIVRIDGVEHEFIVPS
jgi:hypothetical protein